MNDAFSIDDVALEDVGECLVCSSTEHTEIFTARDTLHDLPGEWSVRRCARCGHGFTSPRPDRDSISLYYPSDYSPFSSPIADPRTPGRKSPVRDALRALVDPREVMLPAASSPGKALEVGCGSGRFLLELAELGWDVQGIEPSPAAVAEFRKNHDLPVTVGTIGEAEIPPASLDLVVALMVLEHLHDPLADARKMASWIRPGGSLMGSVPNCSSWEFRVFGPEWFALQVPTHLSHFSPRSLGRLLVEAGFDTPRIVGQRNVSNLMVHLGRALDRRGSGLAHVFLDYPVRGPRALRLATWPMATLLAVMGQAGRMSFLARKPPSAS